MGKFTTLDSAPMTYHWNLQDRAGLAYFLKRKEWKKEETLFEAKSKERVLHIIESGSVRLTANDQTLDLKAGDSLGQLSLIHATSKPGSAVALEDTSTWTLTHEDWQTLRQEVPTVAAKIIEDMTSKMARIMSEATPPSELLPSL